MRVHEKYVSDYVKIYRTAWYVGPYDRPLKLANYYQRINPVLFCFFFVSYIQQDSQRKRVSFFQWNEVQDFSMTKSLFRQSKNRYDRATGFPQEKTKTYNPSLRFDVLRIISTSSNLKPWTVHWRVLSRLAPPPIPPQVLSTTSNDNVSSEKRVRVET